MKTKLSGLVLVVGALLAGCSKKPLPVVEPIPPKIEKVVERPADVVVPQKVDEEALRRQRIQARIAETFKTIYFNYDQSSLTGEGKSVCEGIGSLMKEIPQISARIEGHADERGTNEYNLALGERRAQAVEQYLKSLGVTGSQLSVISYGEEKPAVEGQDESNWAKNRRVEFAPSF